MLEQLYHIPVDKLLHVIVGMLIYIIVTTVVKEITDKEVNVLPIIIGVCLLVGTLKESYDVLFKVGGYWDNIDLLSTVIGGLIPIVLIFLIYLFIGLLVLFLVWWNE